MSKNLVIFDCDGTLIESEHSNNTAVSLSLADLGYDNYDVDICIKKFRGKSLVDIVNIVNSENKLQIDKEQLLPLVKEKSLYANHVILPVVNAPELLANLSINKCVASNGDRNCILKYLEQVDILKYFDLKHIFTRDQVANPKPAPDLFLLACEVFDILPQHAVVVEDSETGIYGAKAAGMIAIGFIGTAYKKDRYKEILLQAGADYIIEDLKELVTLLPEIFIE